MKKSQLRQKELLSILKDQGTGVTSISNQVLSALLGVTDRTIRRDLQSLRANGDIKVVVNVLHAMYPKRQRDIIIDSGPQRRFTINQERELSNFNNHRVTWDDEWVWDRKVDGEWQRSMVDKEFTSKEQVWGWIYATTPGHYKRSSTGSRYKSRAND